MSDRLLCSCPSRGRPIYLKEMLESFNRTRSDNTYVVVYLDDDDPTLKEYDLSNMENVSFIVGERMNVAQIHNRIILENHGYDFYMPINDDVIFTSNGWDKILMDTINENGKRWGIAYPDDDTANHRYNYPTFGCMSANIVKLLGYFYPPSLKMLNGDVFLLDIGRAIGRLYYCPDSRLKHRPPGVSAGAFVPGDHRGDEDFRRLEGLAYAEYIDTRLEDDVNKLLEAISDVQSGKVLA